MNIYGIIRYALCFTSAIGIFLMILFASYVLYVSGMYWKYRHIPSPRRKSFLFGHILNVAHSKTPMSELYYKWYLEVGKIYAIFFVFQVFVITLDPEDIKIIFGEEFNNKPREFVNYIRYLCGQRLSPGGLLAEPDYLVWKKKRRAYDPAFHGVVLKGYIPQMNSCVQRTIHRIENRIQQTGNYIMMQDFIGDCTADILCTVAFSTDYEKSPELFPSSSSQVPFKSMAYLVDNISEGITKSIRSFRMFEILHPMLARSYQLDVMKFREIGKGWILRRISDMNSGADTPKDVLHFMLEFAKNNEKIGLEDLVDDFVTFYSAGLETTASLLGFTILTIHQHPLVLERILTEIEEVVGSDEDVSDAQLQQLTYMEQVFMEVLRMYPLISSFVRKSPVGGIVLSNYHIPQGTLISIVSSVLSRSPESFDDARTFNPDRFHKSNGININRHVFFPFGVGQRNCIGKHFAMMEAKIILTKLLRSFLFKLVPGYDIRADSSLICRPEGDLPFHVFQKQ